MGVVGIKSNMDETELGRPHSTIGIIMKPFRKNNNGIYSGGHNRNNYETIKKAYQWDLLLRTHLSAYDTTRV